MRELVGNRLKEERERLQLSQAVMAELSGASRRAVFAWETGETTPGADALARLAEAGFDVLYVVAGRRTPQASNALLPKETALVHASRSISVRMSVFHERLRQERKRLDLNQTEFAAMAGVTVDSQGNYERGSRKPDSAYLEAIAGHGVDVGYLITGHHSKAALTAHEVELLRAYAGADETARAALLAVAALAGRR